MIALNEQETKRINTAPSDYLEKVKADGVWLSDARKLIHIAGVYYLIERFTIHADKQMIASQSTRAGAFAYADKLCQMLFFCAEITVLLEDQLIVKWARIGVNQWVQRYS